MTPEELEALTANFQAKGGKVQRLDWAGQPITSKEPAAKPASTIPVTPPKSPAKATSRAPAPPSLECKGSIALGSGCKRCRRCKAEQAALDAQKALPVAENRPAVAETAQVDAATTVPCIGALITGMKPHPEVIVDYYPDDQASTCPVAQELAAINDQVAIIRLRLAHLEEFTR